MVKPDDLPSDLASALVALRAEREARLEAEAVAASAQAKLSDTEALIARLQLMIEKLKREKSGQRSERTARLIEQMELQLGVGISTAIRWIARARTGELTARPQGRRQGSSLDAHETFLVGLIEERRDIALHEMTARLQTERTVSIRRSALSAWLRGRGWTFEKSPPMHWSRSAPTS